MNSRMMIWVGYVARMVQMINAYKISVKNLKGREHSEDLRVDGRMILTRILGK
jgi:hypothetical protein